MSRPLRIEYPGALYHVVSRGNGKLWLFKHDDAYSMFLDILGEYIKKYHVVIHNFVIMRNHFHLVVGTKSANLGLFMNQVLSHYAMYFNRVSRRRGSVFQSRYGAFLVQKDVYYKQLTKYVFYNPVKARLVKRPDEYKWSSLGGNWGRELGSNLYILHICRASPVKKLPLILFFSLHFEIYDETFGSSF